ncbi:hypothetical protein CWO89_01260 [Bradyrhizobium sp. Leo170]|nr:hypothetical protein CWO89_01260 [Bradyrhizobium sp. Leo170]
MLRAGGASLDALASKFDVTRDAIHSHWHKHVSAEAKASYLVGPSDIENWALKAAREGDSVIDYLKLCRSSLVSQLATATEAGDGLLATRVAVALTNVLDRMARITGEVSTLAGSVTNITNNVVVGEHPEFIRARVAILQALGPFPEAARAVLAALHPANPNAPQPEPGPANGRLIELRANP